MKANQKPLLKPLIPWAMTPSTAVWLGYRINAKSFIGVLGFGFDCVPPLPCDAYKLEAMPSQVLPDHSLDIRFAEYFISWSGNLFWEIAWAAELEQPIPNPKVIDEALARGTAHAQLLLKGFAFLSLGQ